MSTVIPSETGQCPWCGSYHYGKCGLVSAIEYHSNGTIKRVEFYPPIQNFGTVNMMCEQIKKKD